MTSKDELESLLRIIQAAPESKILDQEFKPKERINLRQLESNGLVRVLSHGFAAYWTITPKGLKNLRGLREV